MPYIFKHPALSAIVSFLRVPYAIHFQTLSYCSIYALTLNIGKMLSLY